MIGSQLQAHPQRIAFRADASAKLGGGHVMRCLTLARAFVAAGGAEVVFLSRAGTLEAVPALATSGIRVIEVGADADGWVAAVRGVWGEGCDAVVVDSYAAGVAEERALRGCARRIVVIDDLANRGHGCDVLIDQNLGREANHYAGLVPEGCQVLAGPRYALLRPEFRAARAGALARRAARAEGDGGDGSVKPIMVSMGLTDVGGITERVVRAVIAAGAGANVDVVVGSQAPSLGALRELAAARRGIRLYVDGADMAALMASAELAVGAAGSTSWERCCLGLPTVQLVLADNQRLAAKALEQAGAAVVAVDPAADGGRGVSEAVRGLVACARGRAAMGRAAAALVDGQGVRRVMAAMVGLELVSAGAAHSEAIWRWRNDPRTRAVSRGQEEIGWDEHNAWFKRVMGDARRVHLVGLVDEEACGVVRFDPIAGDRGWLVSINMAPQARGRGWGELLLGAACDRVGSSVGGPILADIAMDNRASQRVFAACGFVQVGEPDVTGFARFVLPSMDLSHAHDRA